MRSATEADRVDAPMRQAATDMKRLLFWFLLVVFVAVCAWYSFHFTCRTDTLYRAIPIEARFITEHQRLGERWRTLATNAVLRAIVRSAGVTNAALDAFTVDHFLL